MRAYKATTKFFNTGGPCDPEYHYMLPAAARLLEENVMRLIETQSYFVIHAPRQTARDGVAGAGAGADRQWPIYRRVDDGGRRRAAG
ncbi:MAG: hypothetical protein KIS63_03045 [Caldilineales bacterium]|nr:hypothetical protein [Caldilineales bacterium]